MARKKKKDKVERIHAGFKPHKYQAEYLRNFKQFNELICTRRWGKSVLAVVKMLETVFRIEATGRKKPVQAAYLAPEKKQAKRIVWPVIKQFLKPLIDRKLVTIRDAEMEIITAGGGSIVLYATEKEGYESMRGNYYDAVVIDEADKMPWDKVWLEVVRPTLNDTSGWVLVVGTISGKSNLYNIHSQRKDDERWNIAIYPFEDCWQDLPAYCDQDHYDKTGECVPVQQKYDDVIEDYKHRPNAYQREHQCNWDCDGEDQFIPSMHINSAMAAQPMEAAVKDMPVVLGIDASGGGDDPWAVCKRQGAHTHNIDTFQGIDDMEMASKLIHMMNVEPKPDKVFVDTTGGYGNGLVSRMRQLGYDSIIGVNFGSSSPNASYADMRTYMYAQARDWLSEQGNCIPDDAILAQDLSAQEDKELANGRIRLIPKDAIRKKINRSCDRSDAFVLTFAMPVLKRDNNNHGGRAQTVQSTGYSPLNSRHRRIAGYGIFR